MTPQERLIRDAEQPESYVTKKDPTIEDWITYCSEYFVALRVLAQKVEEKSSSTVNATAMSVHGEDLPDFDKIPYARLTDFDKHAEQLGKPMRELFADLKERIGPIGNAALCLVQPDGDDAWHVIIGPAPLES